MCNNDGIVKCIGRFKTFWYKYQNKTYPYTGNSISSRPHTRTLDEPLSCSSFILSKQYNIIYTYNMGHDLYLPAHVVNTKGWDVFLRQCLLSLLMWAIPQISTFSNYGLCTHTIRSSWKSRGRRNLYFLLLANSTMNCDHHGKYDFFMQKFEIFSF